LGLGGNTAQLGLKQLEQRGYVKPDGDMWILTPIGIEAAKKDAYNHQLWDVYRLFGDELGIPMIVEDRQKPIEDVLPGDAVMRLKQKLEGMEG
ncbi:MAG: hypothetical protein CUN56_17035, partial [Phototrophicales bacterium]